MARAAANCALVEDDPHQRRLYVDSGEHYRRSADWLQTKLEQALRISREVHEEDAGASTADPLPPEFGSDELREAGRWEWLHDERVRLGMTEGEDV